MTCANTKTVSTSAESRWTYKKRRVERDAIGHRNIVVSDATAMTAYHNHRPKLNDVVMRDTNRNSEGLIAAISAPRTSRRVDARSKRSAVIRLSAKAARNGPAPAHSSR